MYIVNNMMENNLKLPCITEMELDGFPWQGSITKSRKCKVTYNEIVFNQSK